MPRTHRTSISATAAYRQGIAELKSGETEEALPALEYAAEHGVLGAQLKLARIYAVGNGVRKNEGKAYFYYRQIANQRADISPDEPGVEICRRVLRGARQILCRRHSGRRCAAGSGPRGASLPPRGELFRRCRCPIRACPSLSGRHRRRQECGACHQLAGDRRQEAACRGAGQARRASVARRRRDPPSAGARSRADHAGARERQG